MKNRITELFSKKTENILSVFYTAGFPHFEDTAPVAIALQKSGADMIEIGIPFSDPVADGPVIQNSNRVALQNGMSLKKLLLQVAEIRQHVTIPIILMGYLNPVMRYGVAEFCNDAKNAGVDGVILPDLPLREYEREYRQIFGANGLSTALLISPSTSAERVRRIDEATNSFIYAVSTFGTTGARNDFTVDDEQYFARLKDMKLKHQFLIGFGIASYASFSIVCRYGAGAVVGSSFIRLLEKSTDFEEDVRTFIRTLTEDSFVAV